jgi:hypothetical protein
MGGCGVTPAAWQAAIVEASLGKLETNVSRLFDFSLADTGSSSVVGVAWVTVRAPPLEIRL